MPQQGPPPRGTGPIDAVPCPHCGHRLDFRELKVADGDTLYRGARVSCEACNMMSEVKGIRDIRFVSLEPLPFKAPGTEGQQPRALPQQPRRLLKR